MEEKRNIQISLEEAREWYNSADPFKRDLALRVYNKEELELSYFKILHKLPDDITRKNVLKSDMYLKLINIAAYLNSRTPTEYEDKMNKKGKIYYILDINNLKTAYSGSIYKGITINKCTSSKPKIYIATFNSEKAAKQAIDILGDELKILFE